ncbi:C40 family peptidase [Halpernia frigidisoli]|uniref:Lipoprotein Spr n=1 Tax=Halpernia frigidisoli TaxID=1125876 RepID=A0A1I3H3A6_9FLAO|nr:C40 family peptidase [Halpernia frigidisoli]SFI30040.1 lipoprotein Spr [Halpernia frigidisoli]
MKKRILFYLATAFATFSLQSCVSNYVASAPNLYSAQYKSSAKLASIDSKKLENDKKELLSSFKENPALMVANVNSALKNEQIAKAIRHSKTIDGILSVAESYIGTPYRFGGMTRNGIDCSAFVLSVFGAAVGMNLPRVAASQATEGEAVSKEDLQKGDLVFFSHGGGRISHVGIVEEVTAEGEVKFIHAATSRGVMISSLFNDNYWTPKFMFAKRIINSTFGDSTNVAQN